MCFDQAWEGVEDSVIPHPSNIVAHHGMTRVP
jgi:hypothetical protein